MNDSSSIRVAYLGPIGSYTEQAARQRFPNAKLISCASIEHVFTAVSEGETAHGVVPIENMLQGPVTETQDGLYRFHDTVRIHDMLIVPIAHALGGPGDAANIKTICSKDQALKQCSEYLLKNFPNATLVEIDSTSLAAKRVQAAQDPTQAAIASPVALEHFGLNVLAEHIGNIRDNKTRFAVLGTPAEENFVATGNDATACVIYPPGDRVGILEEILAVISRDHGLSLSSIHSRPDRRGAFRFYVEIEGHLNDELVQSCIGALRRKLAEDLAEIYVFGSYPRCPFNPPKLRTIGIVGGTGKMGGWFRRLFEQAGYDVVLCGLDSGVSVEECIRQSQAVLLSVPIADAVQVARRVSAHLRPGQLVLDNTSVKGQVMSALLEAVPEGVEVLGMHTIFGPDVDSLRKRNTVFTRTDRSGELAEEFEHIFYKYGAHLSYTDETNHDQQMAFHQNLEHFTKIVLAEVLAKHVNSPATTQAYSSPNSRASLRTMARVLRIDVKLLTEIQAHNSQGPAVIEQFMSIARDVQSLIEAGDFDSLLKRIEASLAALGPELLDELRTSD
ncbi:MAG: prephenate dehydrogenase/arogenate dehydrogenase family protein [Gammaproteobacteria bacterium]